jgi:hypothetical protein
MNSLIEWGQWDLNPSIKWDHILSSIAIMFNYHKYNIQYIG